MSEGLLDERVVEMRFDNADFEQNVNQSIKTINKLKESLDFENAGESFENISAAAAKCDMTPLEESIESISVKFNMLEMVAANVLGRIVNQAIDAGAKLAKSLTVDQLSAGWSKYDQKTQAVQTIISATGASIDEVNNKLEKLIWFADETSYDFVDMVNNIGKFTSAGIDLDTAVDSMMGISNWAAASGAGIQQASRAMYNLSQAIGMGYVGLTDWRSIELANMATAEFKETVIATALDLGTLQQAADGTIKTLDGKMEVTAENMRSTLNKQWFTSDVLNAALSEYNEFANVVYERQNRFADENNGMWLTVSKTIELLEEEGYEMDSLGAKAFQRAQEAMTFSQAVAATADAVSSGWMRTFELIFGNYEQAKKLWTDLANDMYDVFASGNERRNDQLANIMNSNYKKMLDEMPDGTDFNNRLYQKLFDITKNNKGTQYAEALFKKYDSLEDLLKANADNIYSSSLEIAFNQISAEYKKESEIAGKLSDQLKKGQLTLKQVVLRLASGQYGKEIEAQKKAVEDMGFNYEDLMELVEAWKAGYDIPWDEYQDQLVKALDEQKKECTNFAETISQIDPFSGFFKSLTELGGRDKLLGGFQNIIDTFKNIYLTIIEVKNGISDLSGTGSILGNIIDLFYNLSSAFAFTDEKFKEVQNSIYGFFHGGIQTKLDEFLNGKIIHHGVSYYEYVPGLLDKIGSAYNTYIKNLPNNIAQVLESARIKVFGFFGAIPQKIKALSEAVFGHFEKRIGFVNGKAVDRIMHVGGLFDTLKTKFSGFFSGFGGTIFNGFLSGLKKVADYLFGYEKDGEIIQGKFVDIFDKVNAFINKIKTIGKSVFEFIFGKEIHFGSQWSDELNKYIPVYERVGGIFQKAKGIIQDFVGSSAFKAVHNFIFGGEKADGSKIYSVFDNVKEKIKGVIDSKTFTNFKNFLFGSKEKNDTLSGTLVKVKGNLDQIASDHGYISVHDFFFGNEKVGLDSLLVRIKNKIDELSKEPFFTLVKNISVNIWNSLVHLFTQIKNGFIDLVHNAGFNSVYEFFFGNKKIGLDNVFVRTINLIKAKFEEVKKFFTGANIKSVGDFFERIKEGFHNIIIDAGYTSLHDFIFGNTKIGLDNILVRSLDTIRQKFNELKEAHPWIQQLCSFIEQEIAKIRKMISDAGGGLAGTIEAVKKYLFGYNVDKSGLAGFIGQVEQVDGLFGRIKKAISSFINSIGKKDNKSILERVFERITGPFKVFNKIRKTVRILSLVIISINAILLATSIKIGGFEISSPFENLVETVKEFAISVAIIAGVLIGIPALVTKLQIEGVALIASGGIIALIMWGLVACAKALEGPEDDFSIKDILKERASTIPMLRMLATILAEIAAIAIIFAGLSKIMGPEHVWNGVEQIGVVLLAIGAAIALINLPDILGKKEIKSKAGELLGLAAVLTVISNLILTIGLLIAEFAIISKLIDPNDWAHVGILAGILGITVFILGLIKALEKIADKKISFGVVATFALITVILGELGTAIAAFAIISKSLGGLETMAIAVGSIIVPLGVIIGLIHWLSNIDKIDASVQFTLGIMIGVIFVIGRVIGSLASITKKNGMERIGPILIGIIGTLASVILAIAALSHINIDKSVVSKFALMALIIGGLGAIIILLTRFANFTGITLDSRQMSSLIISVIEFAVALSGLSIVFHLLSDFSDSLSIDLKKVGSVLFKTFIIFAAIFIAFSAFIALFNKINSSSKAKVKDSAVKNSISTANSLLPVLAAVAEFALALIPLAGLIKLLSQIDISLNDLKVFGEMVIGMAVLAKSVSYFIGVANSYKITTYDAILPMLAAIGEIVTGMIALSLVISLLGAISKISTFDRGIETALIMIAGIGILAFAVWGLSVISENAGITTYVSIVPILTAIAEVLTGMIALSLVVALLGAIASISTFSTGIATAVGMLVLTGVLAMAVWGLAVIADKANIHTYDAVLPMIAAIGEVAAAMVILSGIIAVLGLIGTGLIPLFVPALAAIGAVTAGVILIGAAFVAMDKALQWISEKVGNENITDSIDSVIEMMITIMHGIGEMIGAFVGGVGEGITDSLPAIGTNLSDFITTLEPFIEKIQGLNEAHLSGAAILAGIMTTVVADEVLGAIAALIENFGPDGGMLQVATNMGIFIASLQPFLDGILLLTDAHLSGAGILTGIMASIVGDEILGVIAVLIDKFGPDGAMIQVASNMGIFMTSLNPFLSGLMVLTEDHVTKAGLLTNVMKEIVTEEALGWIASLIDNFNTDGPVIMATNLGLFLAALQPFLSGILSLTEAHVAGAALLTSILTSILINNTLTWLSTLIDEFTGDSIGMAYRLSGFLVTLQPFLNNLLTITDAHIQGAKFLTGVMAEIVKQDAINALDNIIKYFTGETNYQTYVDNLLLIADGIVELQTKLEGVNQQKITDDIGIIKSILDLVTDSNYKSGGLAGIFDSLINGSTDFKSLFNKLNNEIAGGFAIFAGKVSGVNVENAKKAAEILPSILDMLTDKNYRTGGISGFFTDLISGDSADYIGMFEALNSKILPGLREFAKGVNELDSEGKSIDYSNIDSAANAVKSIMDIMTMDTSNLISDEAKGWWIFKDKDSDTSKLTQSFEAIQNSVVPAIASLQKALKGAEVDADYVDKTIGAYSSLIQTLTDFKELGLSTEDVANIGEYIITGLVEALDNGVILVKQAAERVAAGITEGLTLTLEIHSPSKVAYEIGQFVAQGLTDGLRAGEGMTWSMARMFGKGTINALADGLANSDAVTQHAINMVTEDLLDENIFNMPDFSFIDRFGNEAIDFDKMKAFLTEKFSGVFDQDSINAFVGSYEQAMKEIPKVINDENYANLMTSIAEGDYGFGHDAIIDALAEEMGDVKLAEQAWQDYTDVLADNIKINKDLIKQKKQNPPMTEEQWEEMWQWTQEGYDKGYKGEFLKLAEQNGTTWQEEAAKQGYDPKLIQEMYNQAWWNGDAYNEEMVRIRAEKELYQDLTDAVDEQISAHQAESKVIEEETEAVSDLNNELQYSRNGKNYFLDEAEGVVEETEIGIKGLKENASEVTSIIENTVQAVSELGEELQYSRNDKNYFLDEAEGVVEETQEGIKAMRVDAEAAERVTEAVQGTAEAVSELTDAAENKNEVIATDAELLTESAKAEEAAAAVSGKYYDQLSGKELTKVIDALQEGKKLTKEQQDMMIALQQATLNEGAFGIAVGTSGWAEAMRAQLGISKEDAEFLAKFAHEYKESAQTMNQWANSYIGNLENISGANDNVTDSTKQTTEESGNFLSNLTDDAQAYFNLLKYGFTKESFSDGAFKINYESSLAAAEAAGDEAGAAYIRKLAESANDIGIDLQAKDIFDQLGVKSIDEFIGENLGSKLAEAIVKNVGSNDIFGQFGSFSEMFESAEDLGLFNGGGLFINAIEGAFKTLLGIEETEKDINESKITIDADTSAVENAISMADILKDKYTIKEDEKGLVAQAGQKLQNGVKLTEKEASVVQKVWDGVMLGLYESGEERVAALQQLGIDWADLFNLSDGNGKLNLDKQTNTALDYAKTVQELGEEYTTANLFADINEGKWGIGEDRIKALEAAGYDAQKVQEAFLKWAKDPKSIESLGDSYGKITEEEKKAAEEADKLNKVLNQTPEGAFRSIADFLDGVSKAIEDDKTADKFKQFMNDVADSLKEITISNASDFKTVTDFLNSIRTTARESTGIATDFEKFVDAIQSSVEKLGTITIENPEGMNQVKEFLNGIKIENKDVLDTVATFIGNIISFAEGSAGGGDYATKLKETIGSLVDEINTIEIKPEATLPLTEFLNKLTDATGVLSDNDNVIKDFVKNLYDALEDSTDDAKQAAQKIADAIIDTIKSKDKAFSETGVHLIMMLAAGMIAGRKYVKDAADTVCGSILGVIKEEAVDKASQKGSDFVQNFISGLTSKESQTKVKEAMDVLLGNKEPEEEQKEFDSDNPLEEKKAIKEKESAEETTENTTETSSGTAYGQRFVQDMAAAIQQGSGTVSGAISTMISGITGATVSFDSIIQSITTGFATLVDTLNGIATTEGEGSLSDATSKINSLLSGMVPDGGSLAANMIDGIVQGIIDGADKVKAAMAWLAGGAQGTFNYENRAASPAKKYIEFAGYITDGIVIGLQNGASDVNNAMAGVAGGALDQFSSAIAAATEIAENELNLDPVITPVIDLSNVNAAASDIDAALSTDRAIDISTAERSKFVSDKNDPVTVPGTQVFNQYNYSPKALSRLEIYRQTRNQFAMLKGVNQAV